RCHQSQLYEYTSLMPGSARQLRLRPAAVAFALGEAIEPTKPNDRVWTRPGHRVTGFRSKPSVAH
ncbi:MAG: hypothetical protein WA712_17500, partial [Pseudolabrys sp.]